MQRFLPLLLLALMLLGCRRSITPPVAADAGCADSTVDTLVCDTDTVSEPAPPAAADGLFDDFVFNWMRNRRFQTERTAFPVPVIGKDSTQILTATKWKHEPLFSKRDVYTMIFDNERSMKNVSDTAVKRVTVEMIRLREKAVAAYVFVKRNGAWQLAGIKREELEQNRNADFLNFYRRFASEEKFQRNHVATSFRLSVIDPDSYEPLQGTADASQWMLYAPVFPADVITNVDYGQKYADTGERVLVVSSVDGMMSSTVTFVKRGSKWFAVKIENN